MRFDPSFFWPGVRRGMPAVCILMAWFAGVVPDRASAQVVIGRTIDAASHAAVDGVFIALVDSMGARRTATITNSNGHFAIRGIAPGSYVLHATRIGYEMATSALIRLQSADTVRIDLALREHPIALESLTVTGERRCRARPESGVATARLWQDIRAALDAVTWTEEGWAEFRVLRTRQLTDITHSPIAEPELEFERSIGRNSFESAPADSLLEFGFAQLTEDGRVRYHGPDAALLLSSSFLGSHCFSLSRDRNRPGLIALTFEPLADRRAVGIRGGLWVDERSSELRFVEYEFTRLPMPAEAQRLAGGSTEFSRLANGAWIIPRWEMRTPVPGGTGTGQVVGGVGITTGELLGFTIDGEPTIRKTVKGAAFDSLSGRRLDRGRVVVHGTELSASIEADGGFFLDSIVPGIYYLSVEHPILDLLPRRPLPVRVTVGADEEQHIAVAIPSRETSLARFCTREQLREGQRFGYPLERVGMVSGTVQLTEGDSTLHDLRVRIRLGHADGDGWEERIDDDGSFLFCGVPEDVDLFLEIRSGRRTLQRLESDRLIHGFLRVHLSHPTD